jgi:predicted protein tyrosine phosphatase
MPFIQNAAADDMNKAFHKDPGPRSMLIQIMDTATSWWPEAKHDFMESHRFEFLDIEETDTIFDEECRISDVQAGQLVALLQRALDNDMNVIVHCYAGICRSGAVAEIGIKMGFDDTDRFRSPNVLVKHKMMKVLGWTYDEKEQFDLGNWQDYDMITGYRIKDGNSG